MISLVSFNQEVAANRPVCTRELLFFREEGIENLG